MPVRSTLIRIKIKSSTWIVNLDVIWNQMSIDSMPITDKEEMLTLPSEVLTDLIYVLVGFLRIAGQITLPSAIGTDYLVDRVKWSRGTRLTYCFIFSNAQWSIFIRLLGHSYWSLFILCKTCRNTWHFIISLLTLNDVAYFRRNQCSWLGPPRLLWLRGLLRNLIHESSLSRSNCYGISIPIWTDHFVEGVRLLLVTLGTKS